MRSVTIICATTMLGLILACGGDARAQGSTVPVLPAMTAGAGDTVKQFGSAIPLRKVSEWDHWLGSSWYRTWRHWTDLYDLRPHQYGRGHSPEYPRGYDWYNRYCWSDGRQVYCY